MPRLLFVLSIFACVEALAQTQGLVVPDTLTPTNHVVPRFDGTTGRLMGPTSLLVNSADRQLTFTSHSASAATNIAMNVKSGVPWSNLSSYLATFGNAETNMLRVRSDGALLLGRSDSPSGGTFEEPTLSFASVRNTALGDSHVNGLYFQSSSGSSNVTTILASTTANPNDSVAYLELFSQPHDGSTYALVTLTSDVNGCDFTIDDNGTTRFRVDPAGLATIQTGAILGAATTSGVRLDLESGTLAVREGDDSAYGPLSAGTFNVTGTIDATSTITGAASVIAGASSQLGFTARARFLSPSDGVLRMSNSGLSDFNRLQFGGTSSSFPSIKRSSAELQVRLADDSADAALSAATINTGNGAVELAAGTYTPTLTAVANVTGSTQYLCQYSRVGDTVTVSGKIGLDPTTAATLTQLGISLPIASDFSAEESCGGTAASGPLAGVAGAILGDATNNRAELNATIGADAANRDWFFTFVYRVQ